MFLDKIEEAYKKHETPIKAIAGVSLGLVIGMYFYGKYKQSKAVKVVEKAAEIQKEIENGE